MSDQRNQPDDEDAQSRLAEAIDWLLVIAIIALVTCIVVLALK